MMVRDLCVTPFLRNMRRVPLVPPGVLRPVRVQLNGSFSPSISVATPGNMGGELVGFDSCRG